MVLKVLLTLQINLLNDKKNYENSGLCMVQLLCMFGTALVYVSYRYCLCMIQHYSMHGTVNKHSSSLYMVSSSLHIVQL